MSRSIRLLVFTLVATLVGVAQQALPAGVSTAVEQWKSALVTGDSATLQNLYSTNPPARVIAADGKQQLTVNDEVQFWQKTRSSGLQNLKVEVRGADVKDGVQLVNLLLSFAANTPRGVRQRYAIEQQAWLAEASGWKMLASTHTEVLKIRPPGKLNPHLYDTAANGAAEIREAVAKAAASKKRVILMFGGNWCYDCHVLDSVLHEPDVAPIAQKNFIVVHVDIGEDGKKNADLVTKYHIPIEKGVPALAILGPDGKLLYSDQHGEFEKARSMDPDDVVAFLNQWKAK